jgi:D-alanine transaminase
VIYIQISRRGGRRRHEIEEKYGADVLVTVSGFELGDPIDLSAITVEDRRHLMCDIKTVNLLCSVLALAEANEVGCDCAIFLRDGVVTEESRSNVFILDDGKLITHPTDRKILPGIMRANLIALADRLGMAVEEREFGADELYSADEVFVSSTTKFLRRIKSIDGQKCKMAENEIYRQLYRGLVDDFLQKTE